MTRPAPRPLATVTRIPTAAEQTMAMVPADQLVALHSLAATTARFVDVVRDHKAKGWHKVPMVEFEQMAQRVLALAATLEDKR